MSVPVVNALKTGLEEESPVAVLDKKGKRKKEDVRQTMLNLLFSADLDVLFEVIKTSPNENVSAVAMSIVVLLQSQQRAEDFLKRGIKAKLDTIKSQGAGAIINLLRDNSLPVMMLMAFAQMEGDDFLRATFKKPLQVIVDDPMTLEVNPQRESDEKVIEESFKRLEACCVSIMSAVESHKHLIPLSFRRLCQFVRTIVESALGPVAIEKSADEYALPPALKVLSSFMFLRYVIPAVTSPEKYGLLDVSITQAKQGSLVLIAKILTNLCNGVMYGNKENHMMPFNHFLQSYHRTMKEFLIFISQVPSGNEPVKRRTFEPTILEMSVNHCFAFLQVALPKMEGKPVPEELHERLEKLRIAVVPEKKDSVRFRGFKALTLRTENRKKWTASPSLSKSTANSATVNLKKSGSTGDLRGTGLEADDLEFAEDDKSASLDGTENLNELPQISAERKAELLHKAQMQKDQSASAYLDKPLPGGVVALNRNGSRRASILPYRSVFADASPTNQNLRRKNSNENGFKGYMPKYLARGQQTTQGLDIAPESLDIMAPWLAVLWEGIVRESVKTYSRRLLGFQAIPPPPLVVANTGNAPPPPPSPKPTSTTAAVAAAAPTQQQPVATPALSNPLLQSLTQHVIGLGDIEAAIKQLVPVTIAYFSEQRDVEKDEFGIVVSDIAQDTIELITTSPEIEILLLNVSNNQKLPVIIEDDAAKRLSQVLSYVYYDVLLLCNGPVLQSDRKVITPNDIVNVVYNNPSLTQLLTHCFVRENQRPSLHNSLPMLLRTGTKPETPPASPNASSSAANSSAKLVQAPSGASAIQMSFRPTVPRGPSKSKLANTIEEEEEEEDVSSSSTSQSNSKNSSKNSSKTSSIASKQSSDIPSSMINGSIKKMPSPTGSIDSFNTPASIPAAPPATTTTTSSGPMSWFKKSASTPADLSNSSASSTPSHSPSSSVSSFAGMFKKSTSTSSDLSGSGSGSNTPAPVPIKKAGGAGGSLDLPPTTIKKSPSAKELAQMAVAKHDMLNSVPVSLLEPKAEQFSAPNQLPPSSVPVMRKSPSADLIYDNLPNFQHTLAPERPITLPPVPAALRKDKPSELY